MLANTARAGRAAASRLWTRGLAAGGPSESADVVIAGGGIMGLSIAFQLKRREPDMKVGNRIFCVQLPSPPVDHPKHCRPLLMHSPLVSPKARAR
jgi:hypothetical protein